jgi:hypothetical protein
MRSRTKAVGAKEILRQCLRSFHASWMQIAAAVCGSPRVSPLFIVHQRPIIAPVTSKFTFLPRRQPLTTVKLPKGSARLLPGSASAWAVRGSSEARLSPCEELVVSSAHLEDGTTLTGEGLLLGKMAFGSFSTSGRVVVFGSHAASAKRGKLCNGDLTETLMLLKLCGFLCAGTAQPNSASLWCRRHGWLTFGVEGMKEPEAPRVRLGSEMEAAWASCPKRTNATRYRSWVASAPKVPKRRDTWLLQACKGDTVRGRDKGRRV